MAIKKSQLYNKIWAGCDALRGGMDASQYKDYVLTLLFVKYVSDKYAGDPGALIEVPAGASYQDILAHKGKKDIGEKIDTVLGVLAEANDLQGVITSVSFNDEEKLGKGKELVDTLSKLVAIFDDPGLNFSKNRAEGDDILGDAYEYLMRHFATESGKSKGQFYTPAEVSRVIAKLIGIKNATSNSQTIYDPTCGSGSLLLKALEETSFNLSIYGQEKETVNGNLAKMNMILHNNPTAEIAKGQSTLSNPWFFDDKGNLKTFDYIVANPPFSLKNWKQGFNPSEDEYDRFTGYGIPPEKNGDYAFLLHILRSLKSTGKAAVILPHGVLFRGNVEADIRTKILEKKYIKGIIGLPANLFYGTGIPACIIILDKEGAEEREGIFMIDASKGFIKDGNKNRLRDEDIHKITDIFEKQLELPKYSRLVPYSEITGKKNDYNLNIPRYIDNQDEEDIQDIAAHLLGGIPQKDIDELDSYWQRYPTMRQELFTELRRGYWQLTIQNEQVKQAIFSHPEFTSFMNEMNSVFNDWKQKAIPVLQQLTVGFKPKALIHSISEDILQAYNGHDLVDKYDIYQQLLDYWNETMQDDCYILATDGWKAEPYRIIVKNEKTEKETDKGWTCDLVPPYLVIDRYFAEDKTAIDELEAEREAVEAEIQELRDEHEVDGGLFAELDKVTKANAQKRLKEILKDPAAKDEAALLKKYVTLEEKKTQLNASVKKALDTLDKSVLAQYPKLTEDEIKQLVIEDKWLTSIETLINGEIHRISQGLTQRIKELADRYNTTLPQLQEGIELFEGKVNAHLEKMGYVWN